MNASIAVCANRNVPPNITIKRDPMPEAKEMDGVEGKLELYFSAEPGQGD